MFKNHLNFFKNAYYMYTKKVRENYLVIIVASIIIITITQAYKFYFLPDKYFYDSSGILNGINTLLIKQGAVEANTIIKNVFSDNSTPLFIFLNYIINAFCMLFPVHLFKEGLKYTIFALFQCVLSSYLIFVLIKKKICRLSPLTFIVVGFYITSFIFEPDFGSWSRHQAAAFPLIWIGGITIGNYDGDVL